MILGSTDVTTTTPYDLGDLLAHKTNNVLWRENITDINNVYKYKVMISICESYWNYFFS